MNSSPEGQIKYWWESSRCEKKPLFWINMGMYCYKMWGGGLFLFYGGFFVVVFLGFFLVFLGPLFC